MKIVVVKEAWNDTESYWILFQWIYQYFILHDDLCGMRN